MKFDFEFIVQLWMDDYCLISSVWVWTPVDIDLEEASEDGEHDQECRGIQGLGTICLLSTISTVSTFSDGGLKQENNRTYIQDLKQQRKKENYATM